MACARFVLHDLCQHRARELAVLWQHLGHHPLWRAGARGSTHCLTAAANPSCSLLAVTNWARALTSWSALLMAIAKAEVSNIAISLRPSPIASMACVGIESNRERARTT